jgi:hypothetical protein
MRKAQLPGLLAAVLWCTAAVRADEKPAAKSGNGPSLETIKKLAGDWVLAGKDGKPGEQVVSSMRVTAGGTAVVETLWPGTDHEMVTVYHQDGPDLVLTHYCILGNQPRLKADRSTGPNKLVFKLDGGTNLKPDKDSHMGAANITIVDNDHVKAEWTRCENGKACETHALELVRKKK